MALLIIFVALLYGAYCVGAEKELNNKRKKLQREDEVLHELTACQEDLNYLSRDRESIGSSYYTAWFMQMWFNNLWSK